MNAQWKPLALTPAMVRLIGSTDELKGRWTTLAALPQGAREALRREAVVQVAPLQVSDLFLRRYSKIYIEI